ncbi:hypothetical protein Cgig2_019808 [Carnegiea gigantea]|uniref:DUF4283 domain-containing protein n=1 Tax=Carnegiea gigantea TaxID=171969 RepID=A0A9Q1QAD5_9CARY|nr:hypothetical protein Cgig2_019808 [Carnegiea gigantea]
MPEHDHEEPNEQSDEGSALNFIQAPKIDEFLYAKLEKDDIKQEIEYWSSIILCQALEANPQFEIIDGFVPRIWENYGIDKVAIMRKEVFLRRFNFIENKEAVLARGTYFFYNKHFVLKAWDEKLDIDINVINLVLVWVQFQGLDIKYKGLDSLNKI